MEFSENKPAENSPEMLALSLEKYIKDYVPQGWQEPIGKAMFVPRFLPADITQMIKAYKESDLMDYLNVKYDKWYLIEAITDFFKQKINHNG